MNRATDLPATIVAGLTARLRVIFRQADNPYCIVQWGDYYVQFLGREEYANFWFEAVSDYFLEKSGKSLSDEQKVALAAIGALPLGTVTNNYSQFLPIKEDEDFEAAARFGLSVLRDVYGWRGEDVEFDCPLWEEAEDSSAEDETPPPPEPKRPKRGAAELSCGQLLGDISDIGPFLFIAVERPDNAVYQRRVDHARLGIYVLGIDEGEYVSPLAGFILPLSACVDDALARGLTGAAQVLTDSKVGDDQLRRERAIAILNGAGLPVSAKAGTGRGGCLAMEGLAGSLPRLGGAIGYVTSIFDKPDGKAHVTATEPFPWRAYLPMLEWMHKGDTKQCWSHPTLFLVASGGIHAMRKWWRDLWIDRQVTTPQLRLGELFSVRVGVNNPFTVALVQEDYGWARLHLALGEQSVVISLSNVYPPFDTMIEWLKRIDGGEQASAFEIEEEGPVKRLEVIQTDDSHRLLLVVSEEYEETIHIQGLITRKCLVETCGAELYRFFRDDFSAERWDGSDPEPSEEMRREILADPWLLDVCEA